MDATGGVLGELELKRGAVLLLIPKLYPRPEENCLR